MQNIGFYILIVGALVLGFSGLVEASYCPEGQTIVQGSFIKRTTMSDYDISIRQDTTFNPEYMCPQVGKFSVDTGIWVNGSTRYIDEYTCGCEPLQCSVPDPRWKEEGGVFGCWLDEVTEFPPCDIIGGSYVQNSLCVDVDDIIPPSVCSDGAVTDGSSFNDGIGEDGIDCGGHCPNSCVDACPQGTAMDLSLNKCVPTVEASVTGPYTTGTDPNTGTCPEGYILDPWGSEPSTCYQTFDPVVVNPDYVADSNLDVFNEPDGETNPWNEEVTDQVGTTFEKSAVDNGDGTSTETIVEHETRTNDDGSVTTKKTTTVQNIDNSTGEVVNKTVSVSYGGSSPDAADPTKLAEDSENLQRTAAASEGIQEALEKGDGSSGEAVAGLGFGEVGRYDDSAFDFSPIQAATDELMTKVPFSSMVRVSGYLDPWIKQPQVPEFDITLPLAGTQTVSMSLIAPLAEFFRGCVGLLATLGGVWTCIRTWRG